MKRIEAYLSDWAFHQDLRPEQAALLTHVNYSFGHVVEGKVSIAHLQQRRRLKTLQKDYPFLKMNLSIGGWGADGFSPAVATKEGRECLAESALQVLQEMGLDGLDWDWEYPGSDAAGILCSEKDPENMTDFLVLMRRKMDELSRKTGKTYEQSIAVGAGRVQDYEWKRALPALDTVNLMTYDMTGNALCTPVTNVGKAKYAVYSVEECVAAFEKAGVPKEKMLLGAAFYFHVFEGVEESPFGKPYRAKGRNFGVDRLDESWQKIWDEESKSAYYRKGDALATGDDEQSLMEKAAYMEKEKLAGAIIWELNHDRKNRLLPYLAGRK